MGEWQYPKCYGSRGMKKSSIQKAITHISNATKICKRLAKSSDEIVTESQAVKLENAIDKLQKIVGDKH